MEARNLLHADIWCALGGYRAAHRGDSADSRSSDDRDRSRLHTHRQSMEDLADLGTRVVLGFLYSLGAAIFIVFCYAVSPLLDRLVDSLSGGWFGLVGSLLKHLRK